MLLRLININNNKKFVSFDYIELDSLYISTYSLIKISKDFRKYILKSYKFDY